MIIDLGPPKKKQRLAPSGQKVVDLVRARQGDNAKRFYFDNYHINREKWRMVLCSNGHIYIEVVGVGGVVAQIDVDKAELNNLCMDTIRMQTAQRKLHEHRRGAHLWVARPHPTMPGWLMVRHMDHDTPFKPVKVGARRLRKDSRGVDCTRSMPNCDVCGKIFTVGEHAFEATCAVFGHFGGRPRICKGCTQPIRNELEAIEGGKADETQDEQE